MDIIPENPTSREILMAVLKVDKDQEKLDRKVDCIAERVDYISGKAFGGENAEGPDLDHRVTKVEDKVDKIEKSMEDKKAKRWKLTEIGAGGIVGFTLSKGNEIFHAISQWISPVQGGPPHAH